MFPATTTRRSDPVTGGRRPRSFIGQAGRALLALSGVAAVLIGCPLYADDCDGRSDCASGFYCDQLSRRCQPILDAVGCNRPSQCEVGETCTPDFACRPGSCDYYGCVSGYTCGVVDSAHTCVLATDGGGPEDASVPADAAAGLPDASATSDAAPPAQAGDSGLDAAAAP